MKKILLAVLAFFALILMSCNKDGFDGNNAGMVVTTMVRLN